MASTDTYTDTVRTAVVDAIRASGKSIKAVSDATGIPRVTLTRRLGSGRGGFTVSELAAIARALDIDVVTLTAPIGRVAS